VRYKVGDVLLFTPHKDDWVGAIIAFLSNNGGYCHCGLYAGNHWLIEATPPVVRKRLLSPVDYPFITPFYLPELSPRDAYRIISFLMKQVNEKKEYDTISLVPSFSRSVLWRHFEHPEYRDKPSFLFPNDKNKFFCSELIATAFYLTLNIQLCPDLSYSFVTPNDLAYESLLVKRR
jgi:cell wall-associated NlpC family hydrolase